MQTRRVLVYKVAYTDDPGANGCSGGDNGCMGSIRGKGFDSVIGIGVEQAYSVFH
jgi:hypothetical protein